MENNIRLSLGKAILCAPAEKMEKAAERNQRLRSWEEAELMETKNKIQLFENQKIHTVWGRRKRGVVFFGNGYCRRPDRQRGSKIIYQENAGA